MDNTEEIDEIAIKKKKHRIKLKFVNRNIIGSNSSDRISKSYNIYQDQSHAHGKITKYWVKYKLFQYITNLINCFFSGFPLTKNFFFLCNFFF